MQGAWAMIPRPVALGLGVLLLAAWAYTVFGLHWSWGSIAMALIGIALLARAFWPAPVRRDFSDPAGE